MAFDYGQCWGTGRAGGPFYCPPQVGLPEKPRKRPMGLTCPTGQIFDPGSGKCGVMIDEGGVVLPPPISKPGDAAAPPSFDLGGLLQGDIFGIPTWMILAGVAAYFLFKK